MELTVWSEKDKLYVRVTGEIDHHAVTEARREVDEWIGKNRPQKLIMDLSHIDFMDSSGLGFVLGRLRKMNDIRGTLTVLNPARRVEEMLQMAGADKLVSVVHESMPKTSDSKNQTIG